MSPTSRCLPSPWHPALKDCKNGAHYSLGSFAVFCLFCVTVNMLANKFPICPAHECDFVEMRSNDRRVAWHAEIYVTNSISLLLEQLLPITGAATQHVSSDNVGMKNSDITDVNYSWMLTIDWPTGWVIHTQSVTDRLMRSERSSMCTYCVLEVCAGFQCMLVCWYSPSNIM